MNDEATYSIAELARLGDVSRRTIRYYIQRELLPSPTGLGRGKHYTREHLDTLLLIRQWQEEGDSLATIARRLEARDAEEAPPPPNEEAPCDAVIEAPPPSPPRAASPNPPESAASASYGVWLRLPLEAGAELHIRADQLPHLGDLGALARHLRGALETWRNQPD